MLSRKRKVRSMSAYKNYGENSENEKMETYQLTRSKRKSLSIVIEKDGTIQVKAPHWLPKYQIDQFIRQKADWIEEKRSEFHTLQQKKPVHSFQEGDGFLIFGEAYRLVFERSVGFQAGEKESRDIERIELDQKKKFLVMEAAHPEPHYVKKRLEQWYLKCAKQIFPERVSFYYPMVTSLAKTIGKEIDSVNRITIRNQKTRWGSCSSKGNLNFNWRLLMAPAGILDYVVVHELCHLLYLNHSRQFWQAVESILPDYQKRRNWLKANGMTLEWEE